MTDINTDATLREKGDVMELIKEIGIQERHFNELCSKYKSMASTWLLSVFAGIGFVLANAVEPKLLFIAGIGFAGSVGILLLWIIDLRVYQQLLVSTFVEGVQLEKENAWLPPTRLNMINSMQTGGVMPDLCWFYILGVCAPLIIALYALSSFFILGGKLFYAVGIIIAGGVLLCFIVKKIRFDTTEESLEKSFSKEKDKSELRVKQRIILVGLAIYLLPFIIMNMENFGNDKDKGTYNLQTVQLKETYDYLAPDLSEIRKLAATGKASMAHCLLPAGRVSKAVMHATVEEFWYVIAGNGEIWRKNEHNESIEKLSPGINVVIPVHTSFQFRNTGADSLKILIYTNPPWPGPTEATPQNDYWKAE